MVAKIQVPIQSSGTLEPGQTVLLKAPAYPYKDFGVLSTHLHDLSPIALQQSAASKVALVDTSLQFGDIGVLLNLYALQEFCREQIVF